MGGRFAIVGLVRCATKLQSLVLKSQDFWPPYRDSLSAPIQPIGSRLGLGLGVAKIRPFHPLEGARNGLRSHHALADVTNLPLILEFAPILTHKLLERL
jgi:hypothetical protein